MSPVVLRRGFPSCQPMMDAYSYLEQQLASIYTVFVRPMASRLFAFPVTSSGRGRIKRANRSGYRHGCSRLITASLTCLWETPCCCSRVLNAGSARCMIANTRCSEPT